MKDDHNDKHDDQEPDNNNENHPPHVHNPVNGLLKAGRVQKEVGESAESAVIIDNHATIEKVTVTREAFARKSNLQEASFHARQHGAIGTIGNLKC